MATIEERAYEYALAEAQVEGFDFGSVKDGYIKGATDQLKIDEQHILFLQDAHEHDKKLLIDKACEWWRKQFDGFETQAFINSIIDDFRKAMEE